MFNKKIIKLKNQINKYIYDKNEDIYIKLQTIFEFLIKDYVLSLNIYISNYEDINSSNTLDLIHNYVDNSYLRKKELIEIVMTINRKSNAGLKHYNDLIVEYDERFVKKVIEIFNDINSYLFKEEAYRYHINENIFENEKITIVPEKKDIISEKKLDKSNEFTINCGTSKFDYGFKIEGINRGICEFEYKSIYAIIFNLLQRNNVILKDKFINDFEYHNGYEIDYGITYRYEMTILLLIKNNYFVNNSLKISSVEKYDAELNCAINHIDNLFELINRLLKKSIKKINVTNDIQGFPISLNNSGLINIINNENNNSKDRCIWHSKNLKYEIDISKDKCYLEKLLQIIFHYKTFREGQIESIASILNDNNNQIIIMPTGAGKSLIYYFVSYMQPSPVLIIEPTDILIKDQIRNLNELHSIDDCAAYFSADNINVNLNHKLIYLTPRVLQNKRFILSLIPHNVDINISNLILDEIHTISNWSHDFRPDYLMMSFNLNTFLDNARYIGFTATANYRVIKDISQQLNIEFNKIHTPIKLINNNIHYNFISFKSDKNYINCFNQIARDITSRVEEKMLIFTKDKTTNEFIKQNIDDDLKYEIDIFSEDDENSYDGFINGRRSILISQTDMGIGINIPSVNRVMHYGIPISKSKYVQEIGRAGRNENSSYSYITFVDKDNLTNDDLKLVDLNSSIDDILDIIASSNSDMALSFKQIVGHLEHYSIMASKIKNIYNVIKTLEQQSKSHEIIKIECKDENEKKANEICLYFLVKMGIIYNWYINKINDNNVEYDIEVSENLEIRSIKKSCIDYIMLFGNSKSTIYEIENSEKIETIIYELQSWYYNQFLMYHREQLINMIEFVEISKHNSYDDLQISKELFEYFSLTSTNVEEDVLIYLNKVKTTQKIEYKEDEKNTSPLLEENNKSYQTISRTDNGYGIVVDTNNEYLNIIIDILRNSNNDIKVIQMEKYLETKYYILADLFIFSYNLLLKKSLGISRFKRIVENLDKNNLNKFLDYYAVIYKEINNNECNLELINILKSKYKISEIYDKIFSVNPKDLIYYSYIGEKINKLLLEVNL